jgi:prepilin signal peptidase PulO-like enzyme (type II secretory pathway)
MQVLGMEVLVFLLAGVPLVYAANALVVRLTAFDGELVDDDSARALPWQQGPWPARARWAVLLLLLPAMAIAASRFDLLQAIVVTLLVLALLVITATDLLRFRVPNAITYPGTCLALAAALLMPDGNLDHALLAALLGGGVFFLLALVTGGGIGLGDVKLAVLIGATLGLPVAYQALLYGVLAAAVCMAVLLIAGIVSRRQPVPYAPFLSLAAIVVVLVQGAAFAPL